MRKIYIPQIIKRNLQSNPILLSRIEDIKKRFSRLGDDNPEVSIVIPAYNEEKTILQTLASISETKSKRKIEVIVVNNNSTDLTEELVRQTGVRYINESRQGYMFARNRGLYSAKGRYILNADADTLYPPEWIDLMIDPMEKGKDIVLVYGKYAFFPSTDRSRMLYYMYEKLSDVIRYFSKKVKDEAAFVMGANSGYLKDLALKVDGYQHPPGANEDGYLALKLRNFGKIQFIKGSIVWTSDRRLVAEGNIWGASYLRLKKYFNRFIYI